MAEHLVVAIFPDNHMFDNLEGLYYGSGVNFVAWLQRPWATAHVKPMIRHRLLGTIAFTPTVFQKMELNHQKTRQFCNRLWACLESLATFMQQLFGLAKFKGTLQNPIHHLYSCKICQNWGGLVGMPHFQ